MRDERAISALRWEASMYAGPLKDLQGKVVPFFYGFFTGRVDGREVGCIVLEWCPVNEWVTFGKPTPEELRQRMDAVRLLHRAGVKHGQLFHRHDSLRISDGRHFLRAPDGTIRIVGFQRARVHECAGGTDNRDSLQAPPRDGCKELCYAEGHWRRAVSEGLENVKWCPY
ncbi:hypothetical protein BV20DRAFT_933752 [Pilatotrama ljubarskyi]|nr:hypothetical protein BV20DRAFT_933752 [Pilatotrama ljubarskyi]